MNSRPLVGCLTRIFNAPAERFFEKIKQSRRVATHYDKLKGSYLALIQPQEDDVARATSAPKKH
jgi:transposase